jgi:hypothetical protein
MRGPYSLKNPLVPIATVSGLAFGGGFWPLLNDLTDPNENFGIESNS